MSRASIAAGVLLLGLLASALVALRSNSTYLVHVIVMNAVIQKAPHDYPPETIERAFQGAFQRARERDQKEIYLEYLLELSQRLEKVQRIDSKGVNRILEQLSRISNGEGSVTAINPVSRGGSFPC